MKKRLSLEMIHRPAKVPLFNKQPKDQELGFLGYSSDSYENIPMSNIERQISAGNRGRWERNKKLRRVKGPNKKMIYGMSPCERLNIFDIHRKLDSLVDGVMTKNIFGDVSFTILEGERFIFIFDFGVIIFWGFNKPQAKTLLEKFRIFFEGDVQNESEYLAYSFDDKFNIHDDEVFIDNEDPMYKLAISYALAQSIQLAHYEKAIEVTIEDTTPTIEDLIEDGKLNISQSELMKLIGKLFQQRSYLNLHSELIGVPDSIWKFDAAERIYDRVYRYYDMEPRIVILNQRLDLIQELLELFNEILKRKHQDRLEMIVIVLIAVQVCITLIWNIFIKDIIKME